MTKDTLLHRLKTLPADLAAAAEASEPADALDAGLRCLVAFTGAERAFVVMETDARPTVVAASGLNRKQVASAEFHRVRRIIDYVRETGVAFTTADLSADERFGGPDPDGQFQRAMWALPLRIGDDTLGAVHLDAPRTRAALEVDDLPLTTSVVAIVAAVMEARRTARRLRLSRDELRIENRALERLTDSLEDDVAAKSVEISQFERDLDSKNRALGSTFGFANIIGRSAGMRRLFDMLRQVMDYPVPLLVTGESGTGKELIARALHQGGARADQPFMAINCAAIPETLLESELFGYKRGAFTGAHTEKEGLFRAARAGTVFLDEIAEMPLGLQAKLLRVLQEREVRPIGGRDAEPVEARIIAATNRDVRGEVARGAFRDDLYYRLNVVEINVPPLRDRREDIPALVDHFLGRLRRDVEFPARRVSADAIRALMRHAWPGNVRELENCVKSAALLTVGPVIDVKDLRIDPYRAPSPASGGRRPHPRWGDGDIQNREDWEASERTRIIEALVRARWNKTQAASELGISRRNLYRKLARYGIEGSE